MIIIFNSTVIFLIFFCKEVFVNTSLFKIMSKNWDLCLCQIWPRLPPENLTVLLIVLIFINWSLSECYFKVPLNLNISISFWVHPFETFHEGLILLNIFIIFSLTRINDSIFCWVSHGGHHYFNVWIIFRKMYQQAEWFIRQWAKTCWKSENINFLTLNSFLPSWTRFCV